MHCWFQRWSIVAKLRFRAERVFPNQRHDPRVVMHPIKSALDGTDVSGMKDPNGLALFVVFVDKVKQDKHSFVPNLWPKLVQEKPVEKLSYVKGFEPWAG